MEQTNGAAKFVRRIAWEDGGRSGDCTIYLTRDGWKSIVYDITVSGHDGNCHYAGMLYQNQSVYEHNQTIADTSGNVGSLSVVQYDPSSYPHRLKFNIPLTGTISHPVMKVEITSGGNAPIRIDDISMDIT